MYECTHWRGQFHQIQQFFFVISHSSSFKKYQIQILFVEIWITRVIVKTEFKLIMFLLRRCAKILASRVIHSLQISCPPDAEEIQSLLGRKVTRLSLCCVSSSILLERHTFRHVLISVENLSSSSSILFKMTSKMYSANLISSLSVIL